MTPLDEITLNFSANNLRILNILLAFIMFGVALDMKLADFKRVFTTTKPILIGLSAQFLILPAVTFLLVLIIDPPASIGLGMILVAACPGGNISNFITHLAKGNTALSVSMSAVSTTFATVMTPFNITLWGSLHPKTKTVLTTVNLNPFDMLLMVLIILGIPLVIGLIVSHHASETADKIKKPMKIFSLLLISLFILGALHANWQYFVQFVGAVAGFVFLHNAIAIGSGYGAARMLNLCEANRRAVAIEVGIQNSGLGLILIFNFFNGLGGMAILAAWWGIWHIISGFSISYYWSRRPPVQVMEA